jgi:dihydropteroate synthase
MEKSTRAEYRPTLLGVINVSPESMISSSIAATTGEVIERAQYLCKHGVSILDLGGRSITPDAPVIEDRTEQARLAPAVEAVVAAGYAVSVDTWSPETAEAALGWGAGTINFTGGDAPDAMLRAVARAGARLVLTYMPYGDAYRMRDRAVAPYRLHDLEAFFRPRVARARDLGVTEVVIDPNLGIIPPSVDDSMKIHLQLAVLKNTERLRELGCPLLYYAARKPERLARIMMASSVVLARPEYIRTHEPEILERLLSAEREAGL